MKPKKEPLIPMVASPSQDKEKEVGAVFFANDAMINFDLIKSITNNDYHIEITDTFINFQSKNTKLYYSVPMSNVRTILYK